MGFFFTKAIGLNENWKRAMESAFTGAQPGPSGELSLPAEITHHSRELPLTSKRLSASKIKSGH